MRSIITEEEELERILAKEKKKLMWSRIGDQVLNIFLYLAVVGIATFLINWVVFN